MRYRQLGRTGLLVSELCLGTMTFGGQGFWRTIGTLGQAEADRLVGRALDVGINFFDTADGYSEGEAERMLGRALGERRKDVVVTTKARLRVGPGPNQVGLSRSHLFNAVDASLARLGTDYIDLFLIHGYDPLTPIDETLRALDDLVRLGKLRYVGCSNLMAWQLMQALSISEQRGWARFEVFQGYYSLAGRDIERELAPLLREQQVGLMVWSPLAGGLLSGKFQLGQAAPADARRASFDFPPVDRSRLGQVLTALQGVATNHGVSYAQVALAWLLGQPAVTSVVVGAKTLAQLEDNIGAAQLSLGPAELALLDEASALPPEYPGWMLAFQGADRWPEEQPA
jgi:aryl-alcohol dehydrogenase-like predicted oxidoreductase